jgi:ribosomal protein S18 acetylase RimI-like enzyme
MITFYWPDVKRRERYLDWYLGCIINYGFRYGLVYTTPGIEGLSIWLPPDQAHTTTWKYLLAGFLPVPVLMGLKHYFTKTIKNEELVQKVHAEIMTEPHWYLWVIAVDPDKQGQGVGSLLIQPGLDYAVSQQLSSYVETHDEANLPFYRKHGFELLREEQVPESDLRFWCLVRQASGGQI